MNKGTLLPTLQKNERIISETINKLIHQQINLDEVGKKFNRHSLEGLMLKLKLQYFGHLMWRTDSLEKTLLLRKIEGRNRREQQRMRWLDGITEEMDMSLSKLWELLMGWEGKPGLLQSMGSQRVGHTWGMELNWSLKGICYPNGDIEQPFE